MSLVTRVLKGVNKKLLPGRLFFDPEWIILGVNNVCNLKCKMCDVGTNNLETNFAQNLLGSHPLHMPFDLYKKVIDQACKFFPKAKIGFAFTEPLVYSHLAESLKYANEKGFYTSLTTNALRLKSAAVDIIEGGVNEVFVSLDGLAETHNYIRGNNQSFQKAIEGIEFLNSFDNPPAISVFCVITQWNYTQLKEFVDFFNDLPIKHLGFLHQTFITNQMAEIHNEKHGNKYYATHSNTELIDLDKIELNLLFQEIERIKSTKYKFVPSFSPHMDSLDSLETYYKKHNTKIGTSCNDVFSKLMIKTDGSVIPSHGRCFNVSMGNMYESNLKEIWNSFMYSDFRKYLMKNGGLFPACNRCCSAY